MGKLVGKNFSVRMPSGRWNGLPSFLIVASTFGDQQNLTARMTVPIQLLHQPHRFFLLHAASRSAIH